MSQIHPEYSPDESIRAEPHSHVNVNRFTLPKDTRELIVATLLALSILVNGAMYFAYRGLTQTVDLDRYDDNTFINGRFAELSAQVKADHDLIQAYGLQKSLKEK